MNPKKLLEEFRQTGPIGDMIVEKHQQYVGRSNFYATVYYTTRLASGFAAAALPFVVRTYPDIATALSAILAAVTVLDLTYNPKDNWALYAKATDVIVVAIIKSGGGYEKFASLIEPLLATETAALGRLIDLKELSSLSDKNLD